MARREKKSLFSGFMTTLITIAVVVILVLCFVDFNVVRYGFCTPEDMYGDEYDFTETDTGTRVEGNIYPDEVIDYLGCMEVTRTSKRSTTKTRTYYYVIEVYDENGDPFVTTIAMPESKNNEFEKFMNSDDLDKTCYIQDVVKETEDDVQDEFMDWIDECAVYFNMTEEEFEELALENGIVYVDFGLTSIFYTIIGVCLGVIVLCIIIMIIHGKKKKNQQIAESQSYSAYPQYDLNNQFGGQQNQNYQNNMNNQFGGEQYQNSQFGQDINNNQQNPYL